ncbi:MAG TPA: hypothetical protein VEZ40_01770 [Pyrinomonadaceae bacterium]|nr:hypothetical protein [Pyrinomonadaceae bacterium]
MPVIGRLDDQVEAVLINPLARRRPTTDEAARDESTRPATSDEEIAPGSADESSRERRGEDAALPVWLL